MTGYGGRRAGRRPFAPRRATVATALGCLLAVASAACSGGDGTPDRDGRERRAAGGPIVVASGLDVTGSGGVRQQLIEEWNRKHTGSKDLQAKLVELPGGADQQRSQLLGALQSRSARYDVVNLDITWIPEFAEAGLISPMPGGAEGDEDFINQVQETTVWKGRSYAQPFNTDVGLLYYRPDLLEGAGIPQSRRPTAKWTWDNLYASIKTLEVSPGRKNGQAGWTSQLKQYEGLTANTVEAFASVGVELADSEGTYSANEESLKKGLDELLRRTGRDRILAAAFSSEETASLTDFAAGNVTYLRHWPYAYGALGALLAPDEYSVNRLPGVSVLGGQNLAVTADSPRARQARDLITFLTSRESERCLLDAGFAATRASAYAAGADKLCWPGVAAALRPESAEPGAAATAEPSTGGEGSGSEQGEAARAAYRQTLSAALKDAVQRPRTPYYGAFTQALQSGVHKLLTAEFPDSAQAAGELDAALRDAFAGR